MSASQQAAARTRRAPRPFTLDELSQISRMLADGMTAHEIAPVVGRTPDVIYNKLPYIDLELSKAKGRSMRTCIGGKEGRYGVEPCGAVFKSEGPHNRLCPTCRQRR